MQHCRAHLVAGGLALLLLAFAASSTTATSRPAQRAPGLEALDWAFRFATAIDADPTDPDAVNRGSADRPGTDGEVKDA